MRCFSVFLWAMCCFCFGADAASADAPGLPLIGVSMNIPQGGTADDLGRSIVATHAMGARLMFVSIKWSDLEPTPGHIDTQRLAREIRPLSAVGYRICLTVQTLDTNQRTLPADLENAPFASEALRTRFTALLDKIAPELTPSVDWVNLGNEVDVYLGEHPAELEAYTRFIEAGRRQLRGLRPGVAVGVTTTFGGLHDHPEMIHRLDREMDVFSQTYYPLRPDFGVRPISDVQGDFTRMLAAAGSRPLFVQEAGYPAAALLGSSDAAQAGFVDAVFDAAQSHRGQIAGINFFLLCDFSGPLLDQMVHYYGVNDTRFRAYLATLGLKRGDGTARPAWDRFQERLHGWPGTNKRIT